MNHDEMTPERLDAVLDGREPATDDAARDMLALAGALRGASPGAPDELRERVRALSPQAPAPAGLRRRLLGAGRRGRMLVAAPALGVVLAAVVAIGVIARDGGSRDSVAGGASSNKSAAPAAPTTMMPTADALSSSEAAQGFASADPITVQVPPATLRQREAEVRRIVADAGGAVAGSDAAKRAVSSTEVLLEITVPDSARDAVLAAIAGLGAERRGAITTPQNAAPPTSTTTSTLRVRLTETP